MGALDQELKPGGIIPAKSLIHPLSGLNPTSLDLSFLIYKMKVRTIVISKECCTDNVLEFTLYVSVQ